MVPCTFFFFQIWMNNDKIYIIFKSCEKSRTVHCTEYNQQHNEEFQFIYDNYGGKKFIQSDSIGLGRAIIEKNVFVHLIEGWEE